MLQTPAASFTLGPVNATRACLLIHGFCGTPAEMLPMGKALAHQGIRVHAVTLAGHNGDPEELIKYTRKDWLASVEAGLSQLAAYPQVFIAGFSMGGVLGILSAIQHPKQIAGMIALSTPTSCYTSWATRAVPILRYVMKWYYPLSRLNFQDPKVQYGILEQAHQRDPQTRIDFSDAETIKRIKRMVRVPVPAVAELFLVTDNCRRQLGKLRTPLLIIQSRMDTDVDPNCATELYQRAKAAGPKTLHWLEHSDHLIVTGPEREEVFTQVSNFINVTAPTGVTPAQSDPAQTEGEDENFAHH